LVGDTNFLLFLIIFHLAKSVDFVLETILITQRNLNYMNKSKNVRFPNAQFTPVNFRIEFADSGFSCEKQIRHVQESLTRKFEAILIARPRSLLP